MAKTSQVIVIEDEASHIYDVLTDFAHYPNFFSQVKEAKILVQKKTQQDVSFVIDLLEPISCTLRFQFEQPSQLRWELLESNKLKKNHGSWQISELEPGVCEVAYSTEVELNVWVPDAILQGVIKLHLPAMLQSLKQEVERRYAR